MAEPRRDIPPYATGLVWALSLSAVTVGLLSIPRPVAPRHAPALQLERDAVQRQLQADRDAASRRPSMTSAEELEALFLECGRAERRPLEASDRVQARRQKIQQAVQRALSRDGPDVLNVMRAVAVEALADVLAGRASEDMTQARLGTFPNLLAYHHVTRNGQILAPQFVVRTLYKARWNTLHGRPHPEGFSPIEGQAYFGWLALHADRISLAERLAALPEYAAAGGRRVQEAAGVLWYLQGDFGRSAAALNRAHAIDRSLRVGNYARGARQAGLRAGVSGLQRDNPP